MRIMDTFEALALGKYDCQVTGLNPDGKKASFWQAPIMVIPETIHSMG